MGVSDAQERDRERKSWPGCWLPSQARSKGQAWAGVASGFSWFLSDLCQGVGWHQAPLLATADSDEAFSILASAHADTDLSGYIEREAWNEYC